MKYPVITKADNAEELKKNILANIEAFNKEKSEVEALGYEEFPSSLGEYLEDDIYILSHSVKHGSAELKEKLVPILGNMEVKKDDSGNVHKNFSSEAFFTAILEGKMDAVIDILKEDKDINETIKKYSDNLPKIKEKEAKEQKKYKITPEERQKRLTAKYQPRSIAGGVKSYFRRSEFRATVDENGHVDAHFSKEVLLPKMRAQRIKRNDADLLHARQTNGRKSYLDIRREYQKTNSRIYRAVVRKAQKEQKGYDENAIKKVGLAVDDIAEGFKYDIPDVELNHTGYKALQDFNVMDYRAEQTMDSGLKKGFLLNYLHDMTKIHNSHGFWAIVFHPFNYSAESSKISSLKTMLKAMKVEDAAIKTAEDQEEYDALSEYKAYNSIVYDEKKKSFTEAEVEFKPEVAYTGKVRDIVTENLSSYKEDMAKENDALHVKEEEQKAIVKENEKWAKEELEKAKDATNIVKENRIPIDPKDDPDLDALSEPQKDTIENKTVAEQPEMEKKLENN